MRRWVAIGCALLTACGDADAAGGGAQPAAAARTIPLPSVERSDSAGVEIASLAKLPSLLDEDFRWSVRVLSSFSTEPMAGQPLVYDPTEVLPLSSGRLLVLDGAGTDVLTVWDAQAGTLLRHFGRRGEGPGELSGRGIVWEGAGGSIVMVDPANRKQISFTVDGEIVEEHPVEVTNRAIYWMAQRPGGGVLMESFTSQPGVPAFRELRTWGADGRTLEPFVRLDRRPDHRFRPEEFQNGRPMWVALDSVFVTTRSDLPAFRIHDAQGRLVRVMRLPLSMRTLTQVEVQALQAEEPVVARVLHPGPIALHNYLYAFGDTALATFQGGMWRAAEDVDLYDEPSMWRILSIRGSYMGTIVWPDEFRPTWIRGNRAWGVGADSLGIPIIQQLELIPPPALRE